MSWEKLLSGGDPHSPPVQPRGTQQARGARPHAGMGLGSAPARRTPPTATAHGCSRTGGPSPEVSCSLRAFGAAQRGHGSVGGRKGAGCSVIRSLGWRYFKSTIYLRSILPIANKAGGHPARPGPGRTPLKKLVNTWQFLFKDSNGIQGSPEQNHLQARAGDPVPLGPPQPAASKDQERPHHQQGCSARVCKHLPGANKCRGSCSSPGASRAALCSGEPLVEKFGSSSSWGAQAARVGQRLFRGLSPWPYSKGQSFGIPRAPENPGSGA